MYSYGMYYNIEKSGFNAVSAYLLSNKFWLEQGLQQKKQMNRLIYKWHQVLLLQTFLKTD